MKYHGVEGQRIPEEVFNVPGAVNQAGVNDERNISQAPDLYSTSDSNNFARLSVYGALQIPFSVIIPEINSWSVTSNAGL